MNINFISLDLKTYIKLILFFHEFTAVLQLDRRLTCFFMSCANARTLTSLYTCICLFGFLPSSECCFVFKLLGITCFPSTSSSFITLLLRRTPRGAGIPLSSILGIFWKLKILHYFLDPQDLVQDDTFWYDETYRKPLPWTCTRINSHKMVDRVAQLPQRCNDQISEWRPLSRYSE